MWELAKYLVPLLVALTLLIWLARRTIFSYMKSDQTSSAGGFTLGDLRELHKKGAMTDAEFERAKAQLVQGIQAATAREAERNKQRKSPSRPAGGGD